MDTAQANEIWREKGNITRIGILKLLQINPQMSLYQLGKKINVSASTIAHHINKLLDEEKLLESISLVKNKAMKTYKLVSDISQVYKLYLELGDDLLQFEKDMQVYVYLLNSHLFSITPYFNNNLNSQSLICIVVTIKRNNKGFYIVIPENITTFYGLTDPNYFCELDQTIVENNDEREILVSINKKLKE
ncbi:hypothetical protein LCGC14_2582540 [marine sediment metagenome]|uniref:HTH arsR-type domain-containing protein n=1 Tax=marine sediment metagenome TaxID=412755 RepID=A0A0F9CQ51_9ZZZZ|nr:MAG: hypothetical protein HeimC3_38470 [Candidatus Heimdallarchaeota archaeon LC_3]